MKKSKFKFSAKKYSTESGCYLFYDKNDKILYIGKSKNLRKRLSSYFSKTKKSPKLENLVKKITKIQTQIVNLETESLILENNLIKKHLPKYNVLLRDDKTFIYLRITKEEFPKLEITRRLVRDGSTYIGPKTSAKKFRQTINFCQRFFGAKMVDSKKDNYISQLKNKNVSVLEYRENIEKMKKFLRGNIREVLQELKQKMTKFAATKNFEAAANTRDLINSIQNSTQKQIVEFTDLSSRDFINFWRVESDCFVIRLVFRGGKFLDQNEVKLKINEINSDEEILESFILNFYEKVDEVPTEIFIPNILKNAKSLTEIYKTKILVPQKGDKLKVLELAQKNAINFAKKSEIEFLSIKENFEKALPELEKILKIKKIKRMECFDISHFSGQETVGSQVVFLDGKPQNSEYRRYKIKSLKSGEIDDFASMQEVLTRRFARNKNSDEKFAKNFPNLIVLDGGKGQLSSVLKILKKNQKIIPPKFDITKQIIALAKREEEVFRGKISANGAVQFEELKIDKNSTSSKLLQRIRDEAHRFAISFNRNLRSKTMKKSILDEISGIGQTTKKKLMQNFGSIKNIRESSDDQLLQIVNKKQLENLRKNL